MKKQIKKKLSLQRETLTTLRGVTGGVSDYCETSQINDTVYHPPASQYQGCFTYTVGNA